MLQMISEKLTAYFDERMDMSEIDRLKMILGFENILHYIVLFGAVFGTAAVFGVFFEAAFFWMIFGTYRVVAGGLHLSTSLACTLTTTTIIVGGTKLAEMVRLDDGIIIAGFVVMVGIVIRLAPRRTKNYPVGKEERKKLKIKSIIIVAAFGMMALILPHGLKEIIAIAAAAETATLLPNMKNYSEI